MKFENHPENTGVFTDSATHPVYVARVTGSLNFPKSLMDEWYRAVEGLPQEESDDGIAPQERWNEFMNGGGGQPMDSLERRDDK